MRNISIDVETDAFYETSSGYTSKRWHCDCDLNTNRGKIFFRQRWGNRGLRTDEVNHNLIMSKYRRCLLNVRNKWGLMVVYLCLCISPASSATRVACRTRKLQSLITATNGANMMHLNSDTVTNQAKCEV